MLFKRLMIASALVACTAAPVYAQPVDNSPIEIVSVTPADVPDAGPVGDEVPDGTAPDDQPEYQPGESVGGLVDALRAGRWVAAAGFFLLLAGWAARRVAALFAPEWAASKSGGKILGAGTALAVAIGAGLVSGEPAGFDLIIGAIGLAGAAAGFWSLAPKPQR